MNYRYLRIIVTCCIVGTITLALKQQNQAQISASKLPTLKTSVEFDAEPTTLASTEQSTSSCKIKINISSKDLKVRKYGVSYSPEPIYLTINNEDIVVDKPFTIEVNSSQTITTCCNYTFPMNHIGEHRATWNVEPGKEYTATFSWDAPEKIKINGAKLIKTSKLTPAELKQRNKELEREQKSKSIRYK